MSVTEAELVALAQRALDSIMTILEQVQRANDQSPYAVLVGLLAHISTLQPDPEEWLNWLATAANEHRAVILAETMHEPATRH
jgi:hypothetical protein